jgi:hypothetical protein
LYNDVLLLKKVGFRGMHDSNTVDLDIENAGLLKKWTLRRGPPIRRVISCAFPVEQPGNPWPKHISY